MRKKLYILLFLLFYFYPMFSQKILTLEESISIALKESYTYKSAEIQFQNSLRGFESTKLGMLSSVNLNLNPSFNQSLSSQFDPLTSVNKYYKTENTSVGGNLSISQPIIFTNGTLSLSGSLSGQNQLNANNDRTENYYWSSSIRLSQPLFQINSQKISYENAEMGMEKSIASFSKTQMDIVYNVTQSFFQLYKSMKNLEIKEVTVKQQEESFNTSVKKFKAGLIPEVEMLQMEVTLANSKNDMLQSKWQFEQQKNQFKILIGLPLKDDISVSLTNEREYKLITIDTAKAVNLALENDLDIRNWKYDRKMQEYRIEQTKQQHRIKANLNASYGLNNTNDKFDNNLFRDPLSTKGVWLDISVPVWDWGANSLAVESAEATLFNMERQNENNIIQVRQEVMDILNSIELAKFRMDISQKALNIALKSYSITIERYKSGQIKSDELIQEEQRLTSAKLNELNSIIDYKLALANLKRITFYDFEIDRPIKMIDKKPR